MYENTLDVMDMVADAGAECLLRILDATSHGVALLAPTGRVVRMSSRARRHLGDGIVLRGERLCAMDRDTDVLLQAILEEHLMPQGACAAKQALIAIRRGDKRPLVARVLAAEPAARPLLGSAAHILVFVDPDECPQPSFAILEHVFRLTKGEAEVARRLMCGERLQDIAQACEVSIETVRKQVKSVFAKTHTNRQAELVALLTRLALVS